MTKKVRHNIDPGGDPCEAVIALSIGQEVTARGKLEVKHYNERRYGDVTVNHVDAVGAEDLRKRLYTIVDAYIDSYYDFTNGV